MKKHVPIAPDKYLHAKLKCYDERFSYNSQYIFHLLDWIKRNVVASSMYFGERKQCQSEINGAQLVNQDSVRKMISDDQIFSLSILSGILTKIRQFGVYTFYLTVFCS